MPHEKFVLRGGERRAVPAVDEREVERRIHNVTSRVVGHLLCVGRPEVRDDHAVVQEDRLGA